ncbi:50S ribosomal protein L29 [Candidatus Roizmanbacteria bacterium]|nr:50S ribosomal protein L29 [Candidatus Roizmanbacteria bacterium]
MKKLTKALRGKTIEELKEEERAVREEVAKLKLKQRVSPEKDTNILMKKRKKLAVILTVLSEKKELEQLKAQK